MLTEKIRKCILLNIVTTLISVVIIFSVSSLILTKIKLNCCYYSLISVFLYCTCSAVISAVTVKCYGSKGLVVGAISPVLLLLFFIIINIVKNSGAGLLIVVIIVLSLVIAAISGTITVNTKHTCKKRKPLKYKRKS